MSQTVPTSADNVRRPGVTRAVIFFFVYLGGGLLTRVFIIGGDHTAALWPTCGLMLGALLVAEPGEWILFCIAAVLASLTFQVLVMHHPASHAVVYAGCNLLQAGTGNWLLRGVFKGRPQLHRARDALLLFAGCAVSATIGGGSTTLLGGAMGDTLSTLPSWFYWWGSNLVGLLIFTPLVLAWGTREDDNAGRGKWARAETALFFAVLATAGFIAFGGTPFRYVQPHYPYLAFPILLWGTMRLSVRTLTAGTVLLACIAAFGATSGGGAFATVAAGPAHTQAHLQIFLCMMQISILAAGSMVARRRTAEEEVKTLNESLEARVARRTSELADSEGRYRQLTAIAPVGIIRMDTDKQVILVNEKWCAITGFPAEKALGHGWLAAVHPMDRGRVQENWCGQGEIRELDFRFAHTDGSVSWVVAQFAPEKKGEVITGYIGCVTDITGRKEAEIKLRQTQEELEDGIRDRTAELSRRNEELGKEVAERDRIARVLLESESTLRAFFQSAPMMMGIVELMRDDIFFVSVNASAASAFMGGGTLPAAGRTVREMGWTDEEIEPWLEEFRESELRRQPMRLRQRRNIGGQDREFAATVSFLGRSAAGQPRYCYVAEDITESARSQETTERFRAILEATTDMVGMADKFGQFFYINSAGRDLLGLAPDEPLTGLRLPDVHPAWAADLVALEGLPVAMIEGAWQGETAVISRNGPEVPTSELILAHKSPSGSVEFLSTIVRDMSEQKEAAARVKASLEEKEVLLKEIHHRVKNNLQIVSSLLQLQASYISDPDSLHIFEESRDRIKSMALIHEQLYQSNDLAQIDFPEYMRSLLSMVLSAHRTNRTRVETKLHVDPVSLDLDTAIPVGLITNELVTNSLKYAFAGRTVGEIGVRLTKSETGDFLLMVSDNGVGFPEKFNFDKATSLGLRLVRILSKQMRARMEISNGMGTQFRLYFKSQSNS
jgi:PAS domain S-box-containing protein